MLEERFLSLVSGRLPTPRLNVTVQAAGALIEVDVAWRRVRG